MMPHKRSRPAGNRAESSSSTNTTPNGDSDSSAYIRGLGLRRAASYRLPGGDPWHYPAPGPRGYPEAAEHLRDLGLLPAPNRDGLVAMWKAGGRHRQTAATIAQAWELVA